MTQEIPLHLLEKFFGSDTRMLKHMQEHTKTVVATEATAAAIKGSSAITMEPDGVFDNGLAIQFGDGLQYNSDDQTLSVSATNLARTENYVVTLLPTDNTILNLPAATGTLIGTENALSSLPAYADDSAAGAGGVAMGGAYLNGNILQIRSGVAPTVPATTVVSGNYGDITVSGPTWTINSHVVDFNKLIAATAAGIVGATGVGSFAQLTPAQAKTVLAIAAGDVSGLGYFATGTDASNLAGTVNAAQMPALTGDATTTAGSTAVTVTQASGNFSVRSGSFLKLFNAANTVAAKASFDGTTVSIDHPVTVTGNLAATNLSGTNTGDQTAANPSATASDTAVNGTATTFMRSDAAPAIQKASSTMFGVVKVDGTTITSSAGVISAVGGGGSYAQRLYSAFTNVGITASTTEQTLQTYTLPGGTLATNGQSVRITVRGKYASTTRSRQLRLYFGATVVTFFSSATGSAFNVAIEAVIMRTGATTQIAFGPSEASASNTTSIVSRFVEFNDPSETLSGDIVIKVTGQSGTGAAASDVSCDLMMVELLP